MTGLLTAKAEIRASDRVKFRQALQAAGNRGSKLLAQGLYREAEEIMTLSKTLVPVETGTLRDSGFVDPPVTSGNVVTVRLGYGGEAEAYALKQHEDLTLHHPNGQAKFLEKPMLEAASHLDEKLAVFIRGKL